MLVDSHCHLNLPQFDVDREETIERARAAGVGLIVVPGIDTAGCRQALALAERTPEVYLAVGVHPNRSEDFDAGVLAELRGLAVHPKVVAIGEIGLDFYWKQVDPAQQRWAFEAQLALAAELGLPVIVHSREAQAEVAEILRRWCGEDALRGSPLAERPFLGVLHAFSGDLALAQEAYGWNFVLSLGGPITFRNARDLHQLAPQLRLDRLLLETDAPYLTPHPHRGARNEPAYVSLVRDAVAERLGAAPEEVTAVTTAVALRFFGLETTDRAGNAPLHPALRF